MEKNIFAGGGKEKPRWVRRGVELVARLEPARRALFEYFDKRSMQLSSVHPFDTEHGIKTSGFLPGSVLKLGYSSKKTAAFVGYLGVQPSIIRQALNMLPHHDDTAFLDLGCGKGRALVVASEFPFRSIIGVEISPELAKVADENALVIARDFPERTPITVVHGDALNYVLPEGNLIVFLYNPFEADAITGLLTRIQTALSERGGSIWVIYINPVWGHIFDTSSALSRIYADCIPYDAGELGYGPDSSDVVVIWQDTENAPGDIPERARRRIVVTNLGYRAELSE